MPAWINTYIIHHILTDEIKLESVTDVSQAVCTCSHSSPQRSNQVKVKTPERVEHLFVEALSPGFWAPCSWQNKWTSFVKSRLPFGFVFCVEFCVLQTLCWWLHTIPLLLLCFCCVCFCVLWLFSEQSKAALGTVTDL